MLDPGSDRINHAGEECGVMRVHGASLVKVEARKEIDAHVIHVRRTRRESERESERARERERKCVRASVYMCVRVCARVGGGGGSNVHILIFFETVDLVLCLSEYRAKVDESKEDSDLHSKLHKKFTSYRTGNPHICIGGMSVSKCASFV